MVKTILANPTKNHTHVEVLSLVKCRWLIQRKATINIGNGRGKGLGLALDF
jgi:hypothetical protein